MNRKNRVQCSLAAIALCAVLLLPALAVAEMTPTETLKEGVDKIIAILKDPSVNTDDGKDKIIQKLSSMADDYFAFEQLTMRAVGRPWLKMPAELQEKLVASFRKLLELTYLKQIRQYDDEKVVYKREMVKGSKAMVLTDVVAKDKVFSVNYKLVKLDGRWYVYDIIGEGISLVKNYRSQFNEILHDSDTAGLIDRINERVAALEAAQNKSE
ncbi:MlaC/ttg2D family ABC transporter substrate-binding protein [Pseudodesulfovibrio senegalensis]|jgi:phospholipid transport system substrate-binding protein|uniref:ABC transporter substrate-binding protein n=1 Tax=Pseudodesulfovibrio senegalensis TaxID=1721087 RepID=A0A6N6N5I4_9BACT|nr:ABC transporter substrate-binding protein [Pseudodesulfovibrio senegalensis]KAB1442735.1 ABC transporter substrate-binding protein [Pseudodesulfovibrio senegalensis]